MIASFGPIVLFAQSANVTLSARHINKLSLIESGNKRLMKFYRFYKIDSAKQARAAEKAYKRTLDSIWREKSKSNRLVIRLTKKSIAPIVPAFARDSLNGEIGKWWNVLHDSTSSDSVRTFAKEKTKSLILERARQYPGFQHLQEQYGIQGDSVDWKDLSRQVPGLDTLSNLFDSKPEKLFQFAEEQAVQQLSNVQGLGAVGDKLAKAEGLKDLSEQYTQDYARYMNKEYLEEEGKQKAVEEAVDYFSEHAEKLQMAQQKVSKLLSKYKEFSNSNDLSDAVKRTSL